MKLAFDLHLGLVVGFLNDSILFSRCCLSGSPIVFQNSLTSLCILQELHRQCADLVQSLYKHCAIIEQMLYRHCTELHRHRTDVVQSRYIAHTLYSHRADIVQNSTDTVQTLTVQTLQHISQTLYKHCTDIAQTFH